MWFLGYLVSMLIAVGLVHYYAESKTHIGVSFIVAFSWALGFSYFLVLPFDIAGAFCRACDPLTPAEAAALASPDDFVDNADNRNLSSSGSSAARTCTCFPSAGLELLSDIIPICYGLTMLNGYLMNDLLRSYLDSGEFTRRGRLKDAAKDAAYFYVPVIAIGLVFVVYMIAHDGMTFDALRALGRGFINAIGLFILIAFLGYGFVEVPRDLMNKANTEGQLRYFKFRVAVQSEALQVHRARRHRDLALLTHLHGHFALSLSRSHPIPLGSPPRLLAFLPECQAQARGDARARSVHRYPAQG